MQISKQKQMKEAIARLQILQKKGLHENVLKEFQASGHILNYSERMHILPGYPACGILYWVSNVAEYEKIIRDFEVKWDALVYHATLERTEFGTLFDLFFVSKHQEEWEQERTDLKDGYNFGYTFNLDCPMCSEFGTISFKISAGGLIRTL